MSDHADKIRSECGRARALLSELESAAISASGSHDEAILRESRARVAKTRDAIGAALAAIVEAATAPRPAGGRPVPDPVQDVGQGPDD